MTNGRLSRALERAKTFGRGSFPHPALDGQQDTDYDEDSVPKLLLTAALLFIGTLMHAEAATCTVTNTAVARGKDGGTGVGLVEVYNVP